MALETPKKAPKGLAFEFKFCHRRHWSGLIPVPQSLNFDGSRTSPDNWSLQQHKGGAELQQSAI